MTINTDPGQPTWQSLHDRALVVAARSVLAAGGTCKVSDEDGAIHAMAVDGLGTETLLRVVRETNGAARLVLTGPRAQTLGLEVGVNASVSLSLPADLDPASVTALAEVARGTSAAASVAGISFDRARLAERAGIELAKRAGLLPAILALPGTDGDAAREAEIEVPAREVFAQRAREIASLRPVVETRLPIAATEDTRLVVFRSAAGGSDQVALLVGRPETVKAPLCRLHSECLTGDLFGSLRCDCGEQLNGAIGRMAEAGGGILLYLRQEGRGIGLVNKLRAYRLQDEGLDTVDANTHLGFQPDERDFAIAAAMLRGLGIERIRLMTNNPDKMAALAQHGVRIDERVPLSFAANRHNRAYLETKANRSGHLLRVIEGGKLNGHGDGRDPILRLLASGSAREVGT